MTDDPLSEIRDYLRLGPDFGTAGQPTPEQFRAVRAEGFEAVANLLPDHSALPGEAEPMRALGMEYAQIPVWWHSPERHDLEAFCDLMDSWRGRRVFAHCAANCRVSAFVYLYRTLRLGEPEAGARADLLRIWTPNPVWCAFLGRASGSPF